MSSVNVSNTFSNGTATDATKVNQNFTDLTNYINLNAIVRDGTTAFTSYPTFTSTAAPAHVRAYNNAALSIPNNAWTTITLNSERFDNQAAHSTTTNTGRITVPAGWGGLWLLTSTIAFAAVGPGVRFSRMLLNGTTIIAETGVMSNGAVYGVPLSLTTLYRLSAADYVEVQAFQDSGGALNVSAIGNSTPEFSGAWLTA